MLRRTITVHLLIPGPPRQWKLNQSDGRPETIDSSIFKSGQSMSGTEQWNLKLFVWTAGTYHHKKYHFYSCCLKSLNNRFWHFFKQNRFRSCWLCVVLFEPSLNDSKISKQRIPTLLAKHFQAPAKRSHHLTAKHRNIVGRNMLHAFDHPVTTCCDMLRAENRNSAHAQAQHCYTNLGLVSRKTR